MDMLNIVVAKTVAGSPAEIMQVETFEQVMTALVETQDLASQGSASLHEREVILHADPPEAQPHLAQMTARLQASGLRVAVYVNGGPLDPSVGKNTGIIYNAHALPTPDARARVQAPDFASLPPAAVAKRGDSKRLELFVAMSSPEVDTDPLLRRVDATRRLDAVTLGVGWTGWGSGPQRIAPQCTAAWAAKVLKIASALTDLGVRTSFACGLPLCLFSRQQLGHLAALKVTWPIAWCAPQFHVESSGEVRYCARLGGPRRIHISDNQPFGEIARLSGRWAPMKAFCGRTDASSCRSLATRACGAGCLAHLLADWQGPAMRPALDTPEHHTGAPESQALRRLP
jgi:hypothetical protein